MSVKRILTVFDFDGTLFKSPLKPSSWKGAWWGNIKSLTPPMVPEVPGDEWWNDGICEKAFDSLYDKESYTILLTGRIDKFFNERVNELLKLKGLNFPYVGLSQRNSSIDSKLHHLKEILNDNPYFEKIIFYDDREEHFPMFEKFCKDNKLGCEIVHVKEQYMSLEGEKKKLFVLVGPPGVGKSTYINNNPELRDSLIISRDNIAERVAEENGYTYSELFRPTPETKQLNKEINKELEDNIQNAVNSDKNVAVDMTSMSIRSRAKFLSLFKPDKFLRIAIKFMPSEDNIDNLLKSNSNRNLELKKQGKEKNISSKVIFDMLKNYEEPTEEEGFDRVVNVDVNSHLSKLS